MRMPKRKHRATMHRPNTTHSLSFRDLRMITALRNGGVLRNTRPSIDEELNGAITVICGDADRVLELLSHHTDHCQRYRKEKRVHLLSLNGGALLLAPHSPFVRSYGDRVLKEHIEGAMNLKHIHDVSLYNHVPCGMAYGHGLDVFDVLDMQFAAEFALRKKLSDVQTTCYIHVDYGNGIMRTYRVCYTDWVAWLMSASSRSMILSARINGLRKEKLARRKIVRRSGRSRLRKMRQERFIAQKSSRRKHLTI